MALLDVERLVVPERFDASILTEGTRSLSRAEINSIRKWTRRDVTEEEVYTFPVLAIDTQPTRNGVIYSAESQKATCKSWVGTPFLYNANATGDGFLSSNGDHTLQAASQFGRIYKAQLVETGGKHIGTLVHVYSVPDVSPAIREFCDKIDTGILREVSIHVQAKNGVQCSICKKSFQSADHIHEPGEKYGKEICYIETIGALTPIELSAVACPGSLVAHVMDDSEVSSYKLVSLKEALRGSHSPIEAIMDTKLTEDLKNDPATTTETAPPADPAPAPAAAAPKTEASASAGLKLFESNEECPVCKRGGHTESVEVTDELKNQILGEYKEEVEARVLRIMESASKKVADAEQRVATIEESTKDAQAMLEAFVDETVTLAIDKGLKTSEQREAYTEELRSLGYRGVKALREAYTAASSRTENRREQLAADARARFAETASPSNKTAPKGRSAGFAAPIGPTARG